VVQAAQSASIFQLPGLGAPPEQGAADAPAQASRDPRTKVLLTATIRGDRFERTVRIRNMSSSGAMVEGTVLPAVGVQLTLVRNELEVGGEVVWATPGKCGIRFVEAVAVADWIAGTSALSAPRSQARVDALQAGIRSGALIAPAAEEAAPDTAEIKNLEQRLAEEVAYLRRLVQAMGEELSDEPVVLHRHGRTLQQFDIVSQALGHVAAILASDNRVAAVQAVGMEDMRARLLRKALVPGSGPA
jgi:hypothetical protein